jgi:hypothetical protein
MAVVLVAMFGITHAEAGACSSPALPLSQQRPESARLFLSDVAPGRVERTLSDGWIGGRPHSTPRFRRQRTHRWQTLSRKSRVAAMIEQVLASWNRMPEGPSFPAPQPGVARRSSLAWGLSPDRRTRVTRRSAGCGLFSATT